MSERWCVRSFDRDELGRVTGERWCIMARRSQGTSVRYRDHETTACCAMVVNFPVGYAWRIPTCQEAT